jgi:hypothetical protein
MGLKNSKENIENIDSINWNNISSDISTQAPFNNLSNDAKILISNLNNYNYTESDHEMSEINNILSKINNKQNINDKIFYNNINTNTNKESEMFSETSPFISSEMYNYLIKSKNDTQVGGGGKNLKKKKSFSSEDHSKITHDTRGIDLENDSTTSTTSTNEELFSDSSSSNISDSSSEQIIKKKNNKMKHQNNKHQNNKHQNNKHENNKHENNKHENVKYQNDKKNKKINHTENTENSENSLSYVSSSAKYDDKIQSSNSHNSTTINSVRTSEINMLSDI